MDRKWLKCKVGRLNGFSEHRRVVERANGLVQMCQKGGSPRHTGWGGGSNRAGQHQDDEGAGSGKEEYRAGPQGVGRRHPRCGV